jgi:membrane protein required for colicin V production
LPNWLDVVFAIILIVSAVEGLRKGLARTAIGLLAVIVGLLLALWFYGQAGGLLGSHVARPLANVLGFLVIFVGVILLGALVAALIAKLLKLIHLSWLDRLLGGAFGLLRAALVCAVILAVLMAFSPKPPPGPVAESRLAPYVMGTARILVYAAPREFHEGFHRSYEKVRRFWDEVVDKKRRQPEADDL